MQLAASSVGAADQLVDDGVDAVDALGVSQHAREAQLSAEHEAFSHGLSGGEVILLLHVGAGLPEGCVVDCLVVDKDLTRNGHLRGMA